MARAPLGIGGGTFDAAIAAARADAPATGVGRPRLSPRTARRLRWAPAGHPEAPGAAAAAILEPEESWELEGDIPNVVFTCGTARLGNTYFVYYGGADKVIAVATVDAEKLHDFAATAPEYSG